MFQFDAWWFPDGETQLPEEMAKHDVRVDGRLTWQYHKYAAALSLCPPDRRRCAIDIGAHVGLWSYFMARDFDDLHAFEPIAAHRECWTENVEYTCRTTHTLNLYACALGADEATVTLSSAPGESGGTHISERGRQASQRTLDSFGFDIVDLIKIDVEGYEAAVIAGARETLLRCQPILIVEMLPAAAARYDHAESVGAQLSALGMTIRTRLGPDTIWEWE